MLFGFDFFMYSGHCKNFNMSVNKSYCTGNSLKFDYFTDTIQNKTNKSGYKLSESSHTQNKSFNTERAYEV